MSVLELNHVKKSFNNGELQVLQDISLSVEKGEVVAIIGPSGSGKSTLLRCATLLERIDSGEVCFDGHYAAVKGYNAAPEFYSMLLRVRDLLKQNLASSSGDTREHYEYLLYRIGKALSKK